MGLSPNCLVPAPMYPDSSATLLLIPHFILLQFIPGVFTRTWSLPTGGYWRITQTDSIPHLTTTPLVMKNQGIRIKGMEMALVWQTGSSDCGACARNTKLFKTYCQGRFKTMSSQL